jgi:hypothetical protein
MYVSPNHPNPPKPAAPSQPPTEHGTRLATFPRINDGQGELRVNLDEFNGHPFLSIRLWVFDRIATAWWPTKRGVSIRRRDIPDLIAALERAAAMMDDQEANPVSQPPQQARQQRPGARDDRSTQDAQGAARGQRGGNAGASLNKGGRSDAGMVSQARPAPTDG